MREGEGREGQGAKASGPTGAGFGSILPGGGLHEEEVDEKGRVIYRHGALTYTKMGLVALFAWMLWGDFCFTLMEAVVPSVLPLKLHGMDSADWVIALIMSTLPGVFNTTVCPWVSFKSDRYRSLWGRRIPFIIYTMPFLVAALVFIGLSDDIGLRLHAWFFSGSTVKSATVIVLLLAVFAGLFDLFNMFVASVYYYLFNDVVPDRFLARFMAYFRLVAIVSSATYNYFIFRYAESHMREIYLGAALIYLFGFGLMCFKVKEGEYPPPPDQGEAPSLIKDIQTFAKECYTIPFFWYMFLQTTTGAIGGSIGVFTVFFSKSMGLDLNLIGKMSAISLIVVAVCLGFVGSLVDRWHPVRVAVYLHAYTTFFVFGSLVWLFADAPPPLVYVAVCILDGVFNSVQQAMQQAAGSPRQMMLFPRERYGQFCGAQALVRSAGTMVGGLVAGIFLGVVKLFYPTPALLPFGRVCIWTGNGFILGWPADAVAQLPQYLYPYRYLFIWTCAFAVLSFYFHYCAYRSWKRLGGETGYTPPRRGFTFAALPPAKDTRVLGNLLIAPAIAFAGGFMLNAFYVWYFGFVVHNVRNEIVFGVWTVITLFLFAGYVRFMKFMERA